ncbi:hypothetical protein NC653_006183 [Populus alba x Populus x berolinensis]|uniref:Uncharacterized protein n=1 Tax=Populus alba x Populus x berolinensis TaxID=444605 RepID=A0AAD6WBV4_9ROSI|nr:hypothetical protein NC653_006183 [Populus alba x Populus x berolinensis]
MEAVRETTVLHAVAESEISCLKFHDGWLPYKTLFMNGPNPSTQQKVGPFGFRNTTNPPPPSMVPRSILWTTMNSRVR